MPRSLTVKTALPPSLYRMFIDCSGQKPLELEDYPFPGLVKSGAARKARAFFENPANASGPPAEGKEEHLFQEGGQSLYHTGGVDIDGAFRLIGKDGKPNRRIQDIAFPHTSGVRPYSYGLQACSDTAAILVKAWAEEIRAASPVSGAPAAITGVYETVLSEARRR